MKKILKILHLQKGYCIRCKGRKYYYHPCIIHSLDPNYKYIYVDNEELFSHSIGGNKSWIINSLKYNIFHITYYLFKKGGYKYL